MSSLLSFLKEAREGMCKGLSVVLGNESLDLDSAACCIVLAHATGSLPLMNASRRDLPLKTEVLHCLQGIGISPSLLICRDEFDFTRVGNLSLVDHHVLSKELSFLQGYIRTIFDHRPLSMSLPDPSVIELNHSIVGSCASLLAHKLIPSGYTDPSGCKLLYDAILTDTLGLKAAVTTPEDVKALELIESSLKLNRESRSHTLDAILSAKRDIASLSMVDLLRKDLKVIYSKGDERKISLSSLSVSVKELRESRKGFFVGLCEYRSESASEICILTGMTFENEVMKRDLVIYGQDRKAVENLRDYLLGIQLLELSVLEENTSKDETYVLCVIGNGTISRKKLLPFVQEYLH